MLWRIDGADRKTGKSQTVYLEADTREEAQADAERSLIVHSCGRATADEVVRWERQQQTTPPPVAQLVPCPACHKQISNRAIACPACGHPMTAIPYASRAQTPKKKGTTGMQKAIIFMFLGIVPVVAGANLNLAALLALGILMLVVGFFWAVIARIME